MNTFGLRMMEAWRFRPWKAHDKKGRITIVYGTSGRKRTYRKPLVSKDTEQAVLEHCRRLRTIAIRLHESAGEHPTASARALLLRDAQAGLYSERPSTNSTCASAWRGSRYLRALLGADAPARGGLCEDKERAVCAEYMGHRRPDIGSAYNGSRRQAARRIARRWRTARGLRHGSMNRPARSRCRTDGRMPRERRAIKQPRARPLSLSLSLSKKLYLSLSEECKSGG